jgi:hypothetical protein
MKKTSLLLVVFALLCSALCTAQTIDKETIPGHYVFSSLLFDHPIDLNKDGKTSRKFESEADAASIEIQYDFNADGTGKYTVGQKEKAIKWKIKTKQAKTYLIIADDDGFDPTPYEIVEQSKKEITIRGEFRDGSDSTSPGNLTLKKKKQ